MQKYGTLAAALVATFLTQQSAFAFPSGAGCCDTGPGVLGPHSQGNNGSIQDGNYDVLLNDEPPTDDLRFSVCRGETNTFTVKTTALDDNFYVGFRARIESSQAFTISEEGDGQEEQEQSDARLMETGDNTCNVPNAQCPEGVSGITHTDRGSKTEIEDMELTLDEVGTLELEITIVKSVNEWYYSTYSIEVEECTVDEVVNDELEEEGSVEGEGQDVDEDEGEDEDEDADAAEDEDEDADEDEDEDEADEPTPEGGVIEQNDEGNNEEDGPSSEENGVEGEEDESEEEEEEEEKLEEFEEGESSSSSSISSSSDEDEEDECDYCASGYKPWDDKWGGCYCRWCNYSCPKHSSQKWGRKCYDNFDDCECHHGYYKWDGHCVRRSSSSSSDYNYYSSNHGSGDQKWGGY